MMPVKRREGHYVTHRTPVPDRLYRSFKIRARSRNESRTAAATRAMQLYVNSSEWTVSESKFSIEIMDPGKATQLVVLAPASLKEEFRAASRDRGQTLRFATSIALGLYLEHCGPLQ